MGAVDGSALKLDTQKGTILWRYPSDANANIGTIYAPPAINADTVFIGSYNNSFYALNRSDGSVRWQQQTGGPIVGGATIVGDKVLVGSSDGKLHAYAAADGARLWQADAGGRVWSEPVVDGDTVYFGSMDHAVYAVSLTDGHRLWRTPVGGAVVASPLVVNGMVVVGAFDRKLYALDAANGSVKWSFKADNWFWSQAITDGTQIYAGSLGGKLYAFGMDGQKLWQYNAQKAVVAPPEMIPSGVLVVDQVGRMAVVSTKDGSEVSVYTVPDKKTVRSAAGRPDGLVLVATLDRSVYAVDMQRGVQLWNISTKR